MGPYFVGVRELAKEMGVSENSVRKAEKYGRIKRHENGKFDLVQTKRDWANNTHPSKGGKRQEPTDPPHIKHKPLIDFWLRLFNDTSGPIALLLKEETNLDPKAIWDLLAVSFLIQWEIVARMFADGGELPLELSGVAEMLATDEGQRQLEEWLERQR